VAEERLQKLLAAAGVASRRASEDWIRDGRVRVNGTTAQLGQRADPVRDTIEVDGQPLRAGPRRYWLLNKPRGVVTSTWDPHAGGEDRPLVLDLLPEAARRDRLFPVGRLDMESEGLLLLTNDGAVAHALLHPSLGTEKEYVVVVRGKLDAETARRIAAGMRLDDGPMAPCRVTRRSFDRVRNETRLVLVLYEGRKRQIRRVMEAVGHPVRRLTRVRMGPLRLGELEAGRARPLTQAEKTSLQRHAQGRAASGRGARQGGGKRARGPHPKSPKGR
jgi:23S rRNA pseudouridine2605 synthase